MFRSTPLPKTMSNPAYFLAARRNGALPKAFKPQRSNWRVARSEESAELAVPASDKNDFIVGQVVPFSGGWAINPNMIKRYTSASERTQAPELASRNETMAETRQHELTGVKPDALSGGCPMDGTSVMVVLPRVAKFPIEMTSKPGSPTTAPPRLVISSWSVRQ